MPYRKNRGVAYLLFLFIWAFLLIMMIHFTQIITQPLYASEMIIRITGEKNPSSQGYDVGILEIKQGRNQLDLTEIGYASGWESYNNVLVWHYAADRDVSIPIVSYRNTTITFKKNQFAGIVEVSGDGWSELIDLYSETDTTFTHTFDSSLEKKQIWLLAVLASLEAVFLFGALYGFLFLYPKKKRNRNLLEWSLQEIKKKPYSFTRIVIVCIMLCLMLHFAGAVSLWSDDLATIHFVQEGEVFSTTIKRVMEETRYNPPLFYLFAFLWLRVAPYGTVFLKLPSILFCSVGVWLCGKTGALLKDERTGIYATIIAATSWFIVNYAAFTFRCFGLLFLLSAWLCYVYCKRLLEPRNTRHHVLYGILLALMLYTNYISALVFAAFLICDFVLYLRKRVAFSFAFSYIGAGVVFLPLLVYAFHSMVEYHKSFWPARPDAQSFLTILELIFSNRMCLLLLLAVGMCACVVPVILLSSKSGRDYWQRVSAVAVFSVCFVFVLLFSYIYSRYINPDGSIFVHRYFTSIFAPGAIVAAYGLSVLLNILIISNDHDRVFAGFIVSVVLLYSGLLYSQFKQLDKFSGVINQPFEQAIEWIYGHREAHEDSTAVCIKTYQGGLYYYATHGLNRPNLNFVSQIDASNWEQYDTVFVSPMHGDFSNNMMDILNEYYTVVEKNDSLRVTVYQKKE